MVCCPFQVGNTFSEEIANCACARGRGAWASWVAPVCMFTWPRGIHQIVERKKYVVGREREFAVPLTPISCFLKRFTVIAKEASLLHELAGAMFWYIYIYIYVVIYIYLYPWAVHLVPYGPPPPTPVNAQCANVRPAG